MKLIELVKVLFYGILEGITEWLPISSTGHLILFENFWPLSLSEDFMSMFRVVIQLGAIIAVIVLYFRRLNPWAEGKSETEKKKTWQTWIKVVIGCIPAGVTGLLLDDFMDEHLAIWPVVAAALVIYGVAFIMVEKRNENREPRVKSMKKMTWGMALAIGAFQALSIIPGTSRSGSTILGATYLGVSRSVAAEFSFFMAIPVMAGYSFLKLLKFILKTGFVFNAMEAVSLLLGMAVAFGVSMVVIRFLMDFVKKHDFKAFGWYRIGLGVLVAVYFLIAK